jgi:hypothetical protein
MASFSGYVSEYLPSTIQLGKTWNQGKCPLEDEWIKKKCSPYAQ